MKWKLRERTTSIIVHYPHEKGDHDLYHIMIWDRHGFVEVLHPMDAIGDHTLGMNAESIGICVVPNPDPTGLQWDILTTLCYSLCVEHGLAAEDIAADGCTSLDIEALQNDVRYLLTGATHEEVAAAANP